jgi:hypothetical protein
MASSGKRYSFRHSLLCLPLRQKHVLVIFLCLQAFKRKRTPLDGSDESTALLAFEQLCHMCQRARPAQMATPPDTFWSLPYELATCQPQLVVQIERYILPHRNLKVSPCKTAERYETQPPKAACGQ